MRPRTNAHVAAAYREAGHAVAAWDLDVMLMPVSIFPNGPGAGKNVWNQALRNVDFEWVRDADSRRLVERLAAVLMAGPVGQREFAPRTPRGAVYTTRLREVRQLLGAIPGTGSERAARFARIEARIRRLFARGDVRETVRMLSEGLLEKGTLPGDDVTRIIERILRPPR